MEKKKIVIIGAGFTGLSAGFDLSKKYDVTIFEKDSRPGGLAIGFKEKRWSWGLEKHYHHIFTSDKAIQKLANSVGIKILFNRPKTSLFIQGSVYQLDSPISLLRFPLLSLGDRLRTGLVLSYLKISPFWKNLEGKLAKDFLIKSMGKRSWQILWEPLFKGKFGIFAKDIPASWFWARIKKRSSSLGYPEGGFQNLSQAVADHIIKQGGRIFYNIGVLSIEKKDDKFIIKTDGGKEFMFDKVICTLPTPLFIKIVKGLSKEYTDSLAPLSGLGAVNLVLILEKQLLRDGTYWLNINDLKLPFLSVVEHTNFMDKKNYGKDNLVYIGNYLPSSHPYFKKEANELLKEFLPYLQLLNKNFDLSWVKKALIFKAPFAQPLIPLNYSKKLPSIKTPIEGLYLANIQQVYPWDRGTNYAVELGNKVSGMI